MITEETISKLRAAYKEFGGQPKDTEKIANTLNEQGITTAQGKPWTAGNVWLQLSKHCQDLVGGRSRGKGKERPPREAKNSQKEKVEKKKTQKSPSGAKELIPLPAARPKFKKGPRTKQGSFKVRQELYDRVIKKLDRDSVRTDGTVSSLVEILLWMYIGAPEDLLEENPYA